MVRLAAFASKAELRKPEKHGSGLSSVERGAQPLAPQRAQTARRGPRRLRPARPVAGLRRLFSCDHGGLLRRFSTRTRRVAEKFVNNPGKERIRVMTIFHRGGHRGHGGKILYM